VRLNFLPRGGVEKSWLFGHKLRWNTRTTEGTAVDLGPPELLIILAIALLLFGSAKLPKLARSMGQASKEFRKGVDDGASEDSDAASK
jgi:sec-independent protein translocase protein TatA